jgi:hypothetical protein
MIAYLAGFFGALHDLLPVLLAVALLTLVALILDSRRSSGKW